MDKSQSTTSQVQGFIYVSFETCDQSFATRLIEYLNNSSNYAIRSSQHNESSDMADSRDSIKDCLLFVAVVSGGYGIDKTVSSFEFKFAINQRRRIVPVNLIGKVAWPPLCLEIQLASIQYVEVGQFNLQIQASKSAAEILGVVYPKVQQQKRLFISYASVDGAIFARRLKQELAKLTFDSIYLDQDELKAGDDWQNELRDAVKCCSYFVPLITKIYGTTQWTNLEAKYAILLKKTILPVNFRGDDNWPPTEFQIQFTDLSPITPCTTRSAVKDPMISIARKVYQMIKPNLS